MRILNTAVIPGGVRVGGFISPSDSTDTYAVHDEFYGRGGYRSVPDSAGRLAITSDRRTQGMLVKQLSDSTYWTLSGGIADVNWIQTLTGSSSLIKKDVTQLSHGFVDGTAIYEDDTNVWHKAVASSEATIANALAANTTINTFEAVRMGQVTVTAHGLPVSGDYFYCDQVTAGELTTVQPADGIQVLMGRVVDVNTLDVGPIITSLAVASTPPVSSTVLILQTRSTAVNTTLLSTDYTLLVNASGGSVVVTVPLAAAFVGQVFNVKKTDVSANTVTLTTSGADLIDGLATQVETVQYQSISIQSDGTNWNII